MHQTEPNRTVPQIPVFPQISKPINSPNCPKSHSNSNFQPPRDPQVTHKTTLMNFLLFGDGQPSSLCSECEDPAGRGARSPLPTLPFAGFWERLGWVAPSTSRRLWECRGASQILSQLTPAPQWPSGEVNSGDTLPCLGAHLGSGHKCLEGNRSLSEIFPHFFPLLCSSVNLFLTLGANSRWGRGWC